jgi:hypothetical protein
LHDHYTLFLFAGSLEDKVGTFGSIEGDQFLAVYGAVMSSHLDEPWQLRLADFTLELGEVIVLSPSHDFLLDLDANPFCQTAIVDCAARAVALAGVEEEIVVLFSVVQADFARVFAFLGYGLALKDIFVEVGAGFRHGLGHLFDAVRVFCDEILDSAQFEGHTGS